MPTVLDRDQTGLSRNYVLNLAGSRYFVERAPIANDAELDRRLRAGDLALAIEIPSGFARDLARGDQVQIGAWVDGAMPVRAETVRESMPELVQNLMLAAPTTHFVASSQAILFRGAGLSLVWPQFLTLLLIGAMFFTIALNRFRRTISQMA